MSNEIVVTLYKWAGSCGPFKIKMVYESQQKSQQLWPNDKAV